jgi:3-(3-hydroxy-phenyl)propionate hydroxylase
MNTLKTSVVICGAGPAGLVLAHLLGQQDVAVVIVEKLATTVAEPRAIAIDGESLRTLQKLGLYEGFESDLLTGIEADYINGDGDVLFHAGQPQRRPYGFATVNAFDQPTLDHYLAATLAERTSVAIRFGHTLESFTQGESGIQVRCTDDDGLPLVIEADYLVGCDGGRSTVRSLLGIEMHGESNPQPWLVIDTRDPSLDHTLDCRFFCDPGRPGMTIRKRHGERRWEWMLLPGEEREFLLQEDNIRDLIAPFTDIEQVDIYRKRVYDFHAIIAEHWRDGRVFLAGDAAHMTPPFAGQGLNSGFRDVANLSWKLTAVVHGQASDRILDSYELERKEHAWSLIETALQLGQQIQPTDPVQAAERDAFFAELNKDPLAVQAMEDDMFRSILERAIDKGLVLDPGTTSSAGRLLLQPPLTDTSGATVMLDDHLGSGFSIIGYNCNPRDLISRSVITDWQDTGAAVVAIAGPERSVRGAELRDDTGVFSNWLDRDSPCILLVRPDRFCMAAATASDADAVLRKAWRLLTDDSHSLSQPATGAR